MSKLPPKSSPRFVSLGERRTEFVVCSQVEHWVSHWDNVAGRSRRCGGVRCLLCAVGSPKVLRFVAMAVDDRGQEVLIELRERHRQIAERIEATLANGEGVRIVGRKEGSAKNSPCDWRVLGVEPVFRREIKLLVAAMGLPAHLGPELGVIDALDKEREASNVGDLDPLLSLP